MIDITFQKPSLERYRALFFRRRLSVFRSLVHERMMRCGLVGSVLDFGGGARAQYRSEVWRYAAPRQSIQYQSANIDPAIQPTYLLEAGQRLASDAGSFDAVISLSTLEHIYELDGTLAELSRVLKPGGRLIVAVPFMFRVHGHPDDYHRGTPSFWQRKLGEAGFENVTMEGLAWGPFSTGQAVSGLPGPFMAVRRHAGLLLDILWCAYRYRGMTEVVGRQDDAFLSAPLGYFMEARKASALSHAIGA